MAQRKIVWNCSACAKRGDDDGYVIMDMIEATELGTSEPMTADRPPTLRLACLDW